MFLNQNSRKRFLHQFYFYFIKNNKKFYFWEHGKNLKSANTDIKEVFQFLEISLKNLFSF